ncbi:hypothetical protein AVEN_190494-1 [Araneus ventricosus]|uniref:Uncharacterized protein n=1 Tax=Araneus ventricosus TaxID=182803 RepID=A0A4Y2JDG2_ARAVE|nr:hypothetical protein AVEN_190494-1 [Araneus ventricosus]
MYPLCMIIGSSGQGKVLTQEDRVTGGYVALLRGKTAVFGVWLWRIELFCGRNSSCSCHHIDTTNCYKSVTSRTASRQTLPSENHAPSHSSRAHASPPHLRPSKLILVNSKHGAEESSSSCASPRSTRLRDHRNKKIYFIFINIRITILSPSQMPYSHQVSSSALHPFTNSAIFSQWRHCLSLSIIPCKWNSRYCPSCNQRSST